VSGDPAPWAGDQAPWACLLARYASLVRSRPSADHFAEHSKDSPIDPCIPRASVIAVRIQGPWLQIVGPGREGRRPFQCGG